MCERMLTDRWHLLQPVWLDQTGKRKRKKKQRSKLLVKETCSGKQNCSDRAGQEVTWEFAGREEQESLGGREKAATEKKEYNML